MTDLLYLLFVLLAGPICWALAFDDDDPDMRKLRIP